MRMSVESRGGRRRAGSSGRWGCGRSSGRAPRSRRPTCFPVGGGGVPFQPGLPDWWTGSAPYDDPRWIHSYGYSAGPESFNALLDTTGGEQGAGPPLARHRRRRRRRAGRSGLGRLLQPDDHGRHGLPVHARRAHQHHRRRASAAGVMSANAWTQTGTGGWSSVTVPSDDHLAGAPRRVLRHERTAGHLRRVDHPGAHPHDRGRRRHRHRRHLRHVVRARRRARRHRDHRRAEVPPGRGHRRSDRAAAHVPAAARQRRLGRLDQHRRHRARHLRAGRRSPGRGHHRPQRARRGTTIDVNSTNTFHVKPTNAHRRHLCRQRHPGAPADRRLGLFAGRRTRSGIRFPIRAAPPPPAPALGSIGTGGQFDLQCSWTLTAGQQCDYGHATGCTPDAGGFKFPHQCIIADLTSPVVAVPFSTVERLEQLRLRPLLEAGAHGAHRHRHAQPPRRLRLHPDQQHAGQGRAAAAQPPGSRTAR